MAKLFLRPVDGMTLACYSERGLMSFFMFRVLPFRLKEFLRQLDFGGRAPNPFAHLEDIRDVVVFSELDFGNQGFGKPDGAIFFRSGSIPYFIFVEVKLNQSYAASCRQGSYNSTIKGQLELKWRAVTLFAANSIKEVLNVRYLVESDPLVECYRGTDTAMYAEAGDLTTLGLDGRRRLRLSEGVGEVFDTYIAPCIRQGADSVYYLAATDDRSNPLHGKADLFPRCFDSQGNPAQGITQFCWVDKVLLEEWT